MLVSSFAQLKAILIVSLRMGIFAKIEVVGDRCL